jgi:ATP-dependent DNA helicase Rep
VITHKIGRLIEAGLEPKRIAAITFTNKAAAEMRERAKELIGRPAKDVTVCTFHALGVRIMREDGHVLGLKPQFSIMDADDVTSILKDCGGTTDAATARQWQWTISLWKNMGLNAEQAAAQAPDDNARVIARIMALYQERLTAYQSVDFDDLIGMPLKLLADYPEVRERWQAKMGHVLVDEYQDTNATQYEVLKHLVGERGRFPAVGDDDQSIYGWRGATLDNLKRLPQDYPRLEVIALEQNYRSTGAILRAANHVIAANPKLFAKKLWSELGEGEPVALVECDGEEHEAERAVSRIRALRSSGAAAPCPGRCPAPCTRRAGRGRTRGHGLGLGAHPGRARRCHATRARTVPLGLATWASPPGPPGPYYPGPQPTARPLCRGVDPLVGASRQGQGLPLYTGP